MHQKIVMTILKRIGSKRIRRPGGLAFASLIVAIAFPISSPAVQEISFSTPAGGAVSLSSLRGRVVVLMFGGVQDPQCRDQFRALDSLSKRFQGKSVSIYWVSINTPAEASNEQLKAPCGPTGSIQVLRDQNQVAFKRFSKRVQQLPTLVILDKHGESEGAPRGGFNPSSDFVNEIAAVVDKLLERN
jgi:thiol-disulfide isomerase/thioredoxin